MAWSQAFPHALRYPDARTDTRRQAAAGQDSPPGLFLLLEDAHSGILYNAAYQAL